MNERASAASRAGPDAWLTAKGEKMKRLAVAIIGTLVMALGACTTHPSVAPSSSASRSGSTSPAWRIGALAPKQFLDSAPSVFWTGDAFLVWEDSTYRN